MFGLAMRPTTIRFPFDVSRLEPGWKQGCVTLYQCCCTTVTVSLSVTSCNIVTRQCNLVEAC